MRRFQMISLVLFLGALAGCGWGETLGVGVSGAVTYKGQPINGATLLLYPTTAGQGAEVSIPVTQEGTFRTADVPLGDYKIVVQANPGDPGPSTKGMTPAQMAEMKEKLAQLKTPATIKYPDKYKSKEKTDLTVTIAKGEQTLTLELKD